MIVLVLLLALVGIGVVLGCLLLNERARERRAWSEAREARLARSWRALQAAHRINLAFWQAREAMRREAERGDQ
jgi:hypothetical protein